MRPRLLILLIMVFTASCDSNHSLQKHLTEYQARMANVMDVKSQDRLTISLPPYPSIRDLEQNIPATTIKLFEFYTLQHCQLSSLVAERNTTLGNLQLPSTRYIYERRLIDALGKCQIDTTQPKLQKQLKNWQQTKIKQLPMVWANLIQLSSELKQGFSANYGLIEGNEHDGLSQTQNSLDYLLNINQNTQLKSADLEQHLQNLMHTPLPAKLWLSQLVLTQHLNRSTKWLNRHTENLQCSAAGLGASSKQIEFLTNIFKLFFIEKIQPIASQVNHYQYQLSPIFEKLANHPHLSPSFKAYITHFNQQGFQNYQLAMQQHIRFWQNLFKRCNIKLGKR